MQFRKYMLIAIIILFASFSEMVAQNPTITNISPNSSFLGQTLNVAISGQNTSFTQGTGTTNVWFNQGSETIYANLVSHLNDTSLLTQFSIPNNAAIGFWNVNAMNTIDGLMILPNSMNITPVPIPGIVSVNPNSATANQTLTVNITAQNTNFGQGTSTTTAWFEQGSSTYLPLTNINVISSTEISGEVNIPSSTSLGFYNTWVTNTIDGQLYKPNNFEILDRPISLDSLTPHWGKLNQLRTYTLYGHLTHFTDASLTLIFKNQADILLTKQVTNVIVINDTVVQFDCKIDVGQSYDIWDLYALSVTDGALNLINAYIVSPVPLLIDKVSNNYEVQVFPNPSKSVINIRSLKIRNTRVEISIFSSSGALMYSDDFTVAKTLDKKINISEFSKGVYFVQLSFDGNILYQKLLKN